MVPGCPGAVTCLQVLLMTDDTARDSHTELIITPFSGSRPGRLWGHGRNRAMCNLEDACSPSLGLAADPW